MVPESEAILFGWLMFFGGGITGILFGAALTYAKCGAVLRSQRDLEAKR